MENQINKKEIEKYCSELAGRILDQAAQGKERITGNDLKDLSGVKQADRFVLKQIFSSWQSQMEASRSDYFDYDNEEVDKAMKTFANALSFHISLDRDQALSLYKTALQKALIFFFLPDLFLIDEYGEDFDPASSLKFDAPYLVFYKKECEEILKKLSQGMDFDQVVSQQEFGDEDQSGIIAIEKYKEFDPEIILIPESSDATTSANGESQMKVFEKFDKEPSVMEKFDKPNPRPGLTAETEEMVIDLNNLGLNEKLYFSKHFFGGNKFQFEEFLTKILSSDSFHDAREKFNSDPDINLHGKEGMDARNKFFGSLEKCF